MSVCARTHAHIHVYHQWVFLDGNSSVTTDPETTTPVMPTAGSPPAPIYGLWIGSRKVFDPLTNETSWRWDDGALVAQTNWRSGNYII